MESTQDRNLPATPRRLQKAREDGQVPRSRDLTHLAVLGGGLVTLSMMVPWGYEHLRTAMRTQFVFDHRTLTEGPSIVRQLVDAFGHGLLFALALGAVVIGLAVFVMVASGSFALSTKPLMLDLSKIGLISGFGRLFSRQQFFEVLKLTFITAALAVVGGVFVSTHLFDFGTLLMRPLEAAIPQLGQWMTLGISGLLAIVLLVALVDVPLQQHIHRHRLRMSHQELKEEHKESDGNPQLKSRLRQRQREIAQGNSVSRVPKADLVVMNPTHYAVALKYDETTMRAPHVIAKGADLIALRIRDAARGSQVPVLQSPMLARALYANAEIDQEIPSALFTAVAQVLAYVYQLRAALRGEGAMPGEPPVPDVPVALDPHHGREATGATT